MNTELLKKSVKLLFTPEQWWVFPCIFALGFSAPSPFTDNYWIMLSCGVLSFPFAVLIMVGEVVRAENKQMMQDMIRHCVETKENNC